MTNPLADIENICFFDTETRAEEGTTRGDDDVGIAGTYRYNKHAFAVISTWAIGNGQEFDVSLDRGFDRDWLCWDEMPRELHEFHKRVEQREAWYAAWNAAFDREAWNHGTYDFPLLEPDMIVDMMAQGMASNLPGKLEHAARAVGLEGKHPEGQKLINQFCRSNGDTPQSHPTDWKTFKLYGTMDTDLLRDIYRRTRPLPFEEWEDYWVSERINARGVDIDLELARRCSIIAAASSARDNRLLTRWTNGKITAVTQAQRIADWLYDRLPTEPAMLLISEWDEGEKEDDLIVGKLSLKRDRLDKLAAYFAARGELEDWEQALSDIVDTRMYGGSVSPFKFDKMLAQHDDGKLKGQYTFNGAQQTGRYSSRGVQVHNLTRSSLNEFEAAAIEMIMELEI